MAFGQKILQLYHKAIRNESRERCADKKLDHPPIMTYFEKGKTISLHQDLDITGEMAELDAAPLSSADVEAGTHCRKVIISLRGAYGILLQRYGLEANGLNPFLLRGLLRNFRRELR
jgi:hypothetical protein